MLNSLKKKTWNRSNNSAKPKFVTVCVNHLISHAIQGILSSALIRDKLSVAVLSIFSKSWNYFSITKDELTSSLFQS